GRRGRCGLAPRPRDREGAARPAPLHGVAPAGRRPAPAAAEEGRHVSHAAVACLVPVHRVLAAALGEPGPRSREVVLAGVDVARAAARALEGKGPLEQELGRLGSILRAITDGELVEEARRVFDRTLGATCAPCEGRWLVSGGPGLAGLARL